MSMMQKISGYFKQFAGEVSGNQAMHDEGRREAADAAYQEKNEQVVPVEPRTVPGADSVVSAQSGREKIIHAEAVAQFEASKVGADEETAPRQDTVALVVNYADPDQLKLYRLVPFANAADRNWDLAPNQGEVVVRARSSGDARVVAAEAELDYLEVDALPGDGNSTTSSSAFRNEKLYTVVDVSDPAYPVEGPREVVAGTVRVDNIRPTEL